MTLDELGPFYNTELCMTSFGDAASGMLPHIAGSMSTGFIGVTAFLHEGLNPLLDRLSSDATNEEIADLILEASALYDVTHRPLAQKLLDFTTEQGPMWSGGIVDVEELSKRPRFLWSSADNQR
jgi:salicylate hydroxylase